MSEHFYLVAARIGVVVMGFLASIWTLRLGFRSPGHRRTYVLLFMGFALLTLGAVVEGILFEFLGWDLVSVHAFETYVTSAGFVAVLLSIIRSQI